MTELALSKKLKEHFGDKVITTHNYQGQETVLLQKEALLEAAHFIKEDVDFAFDVLMDLTAVDYLKFGRSQKSAPMLNTPSPLPYFMKPKPQTDPWERGVSNDEFRFDVVYHFYSTKHNHRLRIKVPVSLEKPTVGSLTKLWSVADWYEREVWDMYGIQFDGHPNLKRILMYEGFEGHALRKDYPVRKRQPIIGPAN